MVLGLALFAVGCGSVTKVDDVRSDGGVDGGGDDNTAPVIGAVALESTNPGQPINVTCDASDADGDALSFTYEASVGDIAGDSPDAVWNAGAEGEATVTCVVDDGNGGTDSMELTEQLLVDGSLVVRFPFNNSLADATGNVTTTLIGGGAFVADRFGNAGGARSFGGGDALELSNEGAFDFGQTFTLAAWVAVEPTADSNRAFISKPGPEGTFGNFTLQVLSDADQTSPGQLNYAHDAVPAPFELVSSNDALPESQFVHVALVLDLNAGQVTGYVDGVEQNHTGLPMPVTNNSPVQIGDGSGGGFIGALDEVRIYSRAISVDEVRAIAAGTL